MIKRLKRFLWLVIAIIVAISISLGLMGRLTAQQSSISHPLTSLTEAEISTAISVIKREKTLSEMVAFPLIALQEPDKE
jgi:primary-amine oxidase